ncbi:cell division protein FtsW [Corallincola luteus]|uniref:Probable peptidoglycan glycosyltransferase FtsW n=3 Tax=Psychromonadaceae TaxID=267894 RepID=A0A368NJS0_9GAMM|nr:cell division protein FtsW [Corallincola holothuriorum]TCI03586.1 cell division protein FtsW [Corallincola luteus]
MSQWLAQMRLPLIWLESDRNDDAPYDRTLLVLIFSLMSLGLVMVASASMPISERMYGQPFHFLLRHLVYVVLSVAALFAIIRIPMERWQQANMMLLLVAIVLLVAVLIVGRKVNGSSRWLALGPITIQAAEPAKLFFFCYLAGYLVRRRDEVRENLKGFIKPLAVFFVIAVLLLFEPDLGTVVVMFMTTVGMLFLAGAKLWQFFSLALMGILAIGVLAVTSEYRLRRITSFMDPWADPFGSGYQLTQSLMAFGRGSWFGEGLGNSIQKLEYLPEAHTDFVIAVLAEELGFVGVALVLGLLLALVVKALLIGRQALHLDRTFEGYFAYGIAIWMAFQGAVNIGASSGLFPTKGLTLPLISYGGSSLLTLAVTVGILVRIEHEVRMELRQTKRVPNKAKPAKKADAVPAEES